jgi:2-polyprenyl-6-methoxyphenol hydroxylase-like FAD-dependent oxidoreductase
VIRVTMRGENHRKEVRMGSKDVVIVGAGIGGAALATALAQDGLDVLVLEQSEVYEDRVRGESMAPWGVAESRALGVEQVFLDAGAHVAPTWRNYHLPDQADEIPAGMIIPGIEGTMNLRHPDACAALEAAARAAGATVCRGTRDLDVTPGREPRVRWRDADGEHDVPCRMIVGGDGRTSRVRKALGLELERAPVLNHIAGLLLDDLEDVEEEHDFIGGEGDLFIAGFHQGGGRARVYLCPSTADAKRYVGEGNVDRFLKECAFQCVPFGKNLSKGTPAGPLATYPGDDTWIDEPYGDGAVLVADAAGYSNPIIGQGLSIAMRDARTVRDVLRGDDWSAAGFGDYGEERKERMRRLRFIANTLAIVEVEPATNREARRRKWGELMEADPRAFMMLIGAFAGPEAAPDDAFDDEFHAAVRAA